MPDEVPAAGARARSVPRQPYAVETLRKLRVKNHRRSHGHIAPVKAAQIHAPRIVCVLGPARGGTSLATRLLALLGVYLGPDERIHQAWDFNEKGSWEYRPFWEIDREILTRLFGPDWMLSLPPLPTGWADPPAFEDLKQRARAAISQDFFAAPVWGWKHPQTCLTLPFWQSILPSMTYVVCVREPAEVAASANEKLGCTFEQGLYLWLRFLLSVLEHTEPDERLLISTTIGFAIPQSSWTPWRDC